MIAILILNFTPQRTQLTSKRKLST